MDITSSIEGGVAVLSIAGRIDFASSGDFETAASRAIEQGGARLIFDMRAVGYVSSAGLRAILVAAKKAKSAGGGVALFGLQSGVEEVFATSGFGQIVPIAADDAGARERLKG
jgi:anti-sigma B factor antagonist